MSLGEKSEFKYVSMLYVHNSQPVCIRHRMRWNPETCKIASILMTMPKPTLMLDSRYGCETDLHNMCMRSDTEEEGNSSNQTFSFASCYVAFSWHATD